MAVKL